jgi:hypothetical protein
MNHAFYRMKVQFVYEHGIIMMNIRLKFCIKIIGLVQRIVVEKDFDIHNNEGKLQGTGYKAQGSRGSSGKDIFSQVY